MDQKDNLDRFLEGALANLSDASPRDGLEQRILANLAAKEAQRSSWRWVWIAVPALTAVLLAVLVGPKVSHKQDAPVATSLETTRRVPTAEAAPLQREVKHATSTRSQRQTKVRAEVMADAQAKLEPRLATFPSPDEGEQQARMLLHFVIGHPEQAKEVVREEQQFQQMAKAMMNRESENRSEREQ